MSRYVPDDRQTFTVASSIGSAKRAEREELAAKTAEFLANGGEIKVYDSTVSSGQSNDYTEAMRRNCRLGNKKRWAAHSVKVEEKP